MIDIENGSLLLVDKPYTWTSFQVVNKIKYYIKHRYGIKKFKIGHAGTLDPLATGLLIICVGKFTKRIEEFQSQEKEYTGTFCLGATTPCFDLEQPIDKEYSYKHINLEDIIRVSKDFIGETLQFPPMFSAVKYKGKRAYQLARENIAVDLKSKKIFINEFEITKINLPEVDFRITCSKGTYIRSIVRDFGEALNSGAHLTKLVRTRIGDFKLEKAHSISFFDEAIS